MLLRPTRRLAGVVSPIRPSAVVVAYGSKCVSGDGHSPRSVAAFDPADAALGEFLRQRRF